MNFFDPVWQISFGLTLLVELGIVTTWHFLSGSRQYRPLIPLLLLVVGLNLITHPLAWLASSLKIDLLQIELAVGLAEALGLSMVPQLRWWQAVQLSFGMNVGSFVLGSAVWLLVFQS